MEVLFVLVFFATPFLVWWFFRHMRAQGSGRGPSWIGSLVLGFFVLVAAGALFLETPDEVQTAKTDAEMAPMSGQGDVVEEHAQPMPLRGIGVSHDSIVNAMSGDFVPEHAVPVDGQPRRLAQAKNRLALLETIGAPDDVGSATLILFVSSESPATVVQNAAYGIVFAKTVLPAWPHASQWVIESIQKMTGGEANEQEVSQDGVVANISIARELGMIVISVKREQDAN